MVCSHFDVLVLFNIATLDSERYKKNENSKTSCGTTPGMTNNFMGVFDVILVIKRNNYTYSFNMKLLLSLPCLGCLKKELV